jgi:hypothetical protein
MALTIPAAAALAQPDDEAQAEAPIPNPADADSLEDYTSRYAGNVRVTGVGTETTLHYPCYACAAPGLFTQRILDGSNAIVAGATCSECGRRFRGVVTGHPVGGMRVEIVQSSGDDPPAYLPAFRRVE